MNKFKTILIIDDNEIDIMINKKAIDQLKIDVNVQTFQNAMLALEYLKLIQRDVSQFKQVSPLLILLDNNMPVMTGLEFLEEFNSLGIVEQQIDIVMISADYPSLIEKAIHQKCAAYIEKPLTSEKLRFQLENIYG